MVLNLPFHKMTHNKSTDYKIYISKKTRNEKSRRIIYKFSYKMGVFTSYEMRKGVKLQGCKTPTEHNGLRYNTDKHTFYKTL